MESDASEVITVERASVLSDSGVKEGDEECEDPFAGLEQDAEEVETTKLSWMTASYERTEN